MAVKRAMEDSRLYYSEVHVQPTDTATTPGLSSKGTTDLFATPIPGQEETTTAHKEESAGKKQDNREQVASAENKYEPTYTEFGMPPGMMMEFGMPLSDHHMAPRKVETQEPFPELLEAWSYTEDEKKTMVNRIERIKQSYSE